MLMRRAGGDRRVDWACVTISEQLREVLEGLPLIEALAPDERLAVHRAGKRLVANDREPHRAERDAADPDVPVLARRGAHGLRLPERAVIGHRARERAGGPRRRRGLRRPGGRRRARAGAAGAGCTARAAGAACGAVAGRGLDAGPGTARGATGGRGAPAGRGRAWDAGRGGAGATPWPRDEASGGFNGLAAPASAGGASSLGGATCASSPRLARRLDRESSRHGALGDARADLNEVPASPALHPHHLAGDLLVTDLVLGLAVIADGLHPRTRLPVEWRSLRQLGPRRHGVGGQSSPSKCSLIDCRVGSSGATPSARSQVSMALLRNPAF